MMHFDVLLLFLYTHNLYTVKISIKYSFSVACSPKKISLLFGDLDAYAIGGLFQGDVSFIYIIILSIIHVCNY